MNGYAKFYINPMNGVAYLSWLHCGKGGVTVPSTFEGEGQARLADEAEWGYRVALAMIHSFNHGLLNIS